MPQCTYGNGFIDDRQYDLQGRLTHQLLKNAVNTVIDERTYSYDKNSNILGIDTNTEDNLYAYDKLDRVIQDAINGDMPIRFIYDLNDNRLSRQLSDLSNDEIIGYAEGSNRIQTLDTVLAGIIPINPLLDRDLVHNDAGRLFQLSEDGNLKVEYIYNDQGQRTRKVVHNPDLTTRTTIYHYGRMGNLVTETDETGQLIKDYIWNEVHPVAQIDNTQGSEQVLYLHTDHLMTNRLATNQSQTVVWRWEGEAFGNTAAQELAGVSVNLRFAGQYFDQETGLHNNYFRYYDPSTGSQHREVHYQ